VLGTDFIRRSQYSGGGGLLVSDCYEDKSTKRTGTTGFFSYSFYFSQFCKSTYFIEKFTGTSMREQN
jgi:hypothetical protein